MPSNVYTGTVANLPRESRFNGKYQRTGVIMDSANINFVFLDGREITKHVLHDGRRAGHSHPFDMFIYVVEGQLIFHVDHKDYVLNAGDFIYVPRDLDHGGQSANGEPVKLLEIFAPIRTDYLYTAEHQLGINQPPRNPDGSRVDDRSLAEVASAMSDSKFTASE